MRTLKKLIEFPSTVNLIAIESVNDQRQMKSMLINYILYLFVFAFCFGSCNNEPELGFDEIRIDSEMIRWITPFSPTDQLFNYSCDSIKNSGYLLVTHLNNEIEVGEEFCLPISDHERGECQNRTIRFGGKDGKIFYLTLWVFAEDWMNINPSSSQRLVKEIFRYYEFTRELEEVCSDIYSIEFDSTFQYNNDLHEAIIVQDTARGHSKAPKKFTIVKGIGITEWEDYDSNKFILDE